MAARFLFYAYQVDTFGGSTTFQQAGGAVQSVPTVGTLIHAPAPGTVAGVNNVTINALVEILPTATQLKSRTYYTDSTVSALNTAGA